jgi:hypothetical protein
MDQRERIAAQLEMYFDDMFTERYFEGDDWILSEEPRIVASLSATGFESAALPKFYLTLAAGVVEGLEDTSFIHRLISHLNAEHTYVKIVPYPGNANGKVDVYTLIAIPADDLQEREVTLASLMIRMFAEHLPVRIFRAVATQEIE